MARLSTTLAVLAFCMAPSGAAGAQDVAAEMIQEVTTGVTAGVTIGPELASQVRVILDELCVSCHNPEATDRKARRRYDYADDMERTVEDYVIPGDPEDSDLWLTIEDGSMPPEDSDLPQLDAAQRATVVNWIMAGAPLPPPESGQAGTPSEPAATLNDPGNTQGPSLTAAPTVVTSGKAAPTEGDIERLIAFAGKTHPLAVHLPIGLLLGAALAEIALFLGARSSMREVVRFCVLVGSLGAMGAGILGWLDAWNVSIPEKELQLHRWTGVVFSVFCSGLLFQSERTARADGRDADGFDDDEAFASRTNLRWLLLVAVLLMSAVGHFGGELVYGEDYLSL